MLCVYNNTDISYYYFTNDNAASKFSTFIVLYNVHDIVCTYVCIPMYVHVQCMYMYNVYTLYMYYYWKAPIME